MDIEVSKKHEKSLKVGDIVHILYKNGIERTYVIALSSDYHRMINLDGIHNGISYGLLSTLETEIFKIPMAKKIDIYSKEEYKLQLVKKEVM